MQGSDHAQMNGVDGGVRPPPLPEMVTLEPVDTGPSAPAGTFFKSLLWKASFAELTREAESKVAVPILWVVKLLRLNVPGSFADPGVTELAYFEVPRLASEFEKEMGKTVEELNAMGFMSGNGVSYDIHDVVNKSRWMLLAMPHVSGTAVGIAFFKTEGSQGRRKLRGTEFLTECVDGSWRWTSSVTQRLNAGPEMKRRMLAGAGPRILWETHRATTVPAAVAVSGVDGVRTLVERHHRQHTANLIARGLFRERNVQELQQTLSMNDAYKKTEISRNAGVLAELERLQTSKSNLASTLLILFVSVALFVAMSRNMGSMFNSWEMVGLLVGVLFFHELGHYVAMKALGYQNLKMFFIPMFGAAVSGTNYSAPGWKRVVVSLAGPVPGIIVGAVLGICTVVSPGNQWVLKSAILLLVLNVFNLIPILPLDGGHVARTLLFARHWVLDVLFRLTAVLVMGALSLGLGDRFLFFLAIAMAIGIPLAIKQGRAAESLAKKGLVLEMAGTKIAPQTAEAILNELQPKNEKPSKLADVRLAQQTLAVFETMSQRPPGWLATTGFLGLHVGVVVIAMVVGMVMLVGGRNGAFRSLARTANMTPEMTFRFSDFEVTHANLSEPTTRPGKYGGAVYRQGVFGYFKNDAAAKIAYDEFKSVLGKQESICRLGRGVFVTLPVDSERKAWIDRIEGKTKNFEYIGGERHGRGIRLQAVLPDEESAKAVQIALTNIPIRSGKKTLIPEWSPAWSEASPVQQKAWRQARAAYMAYYKMLDPSEDLFQTNDLRRELSKKLRAAEKRGDEKEVERLTQQMHEESEALHKKEIDKLVASADSAGLDVVVLRKLAEHDAAQRRQIMARTATRPDFDPDDDGSYAYTKEPYEIFERMGLMEADSAAWKYRLERSYTHRTSLIVQASGVMFLDMPEGCEALLKWLEKMGATGLRYDLPKENPGETEW